VASMVQTGRFRCAVWLDTVGTEPWMVVESMAWQRQRTITGIGLFTTDKSSTVGRPVQMRQRKAFVVSGNCREFSKRR